MPRYVPIVIVLAATATTISLQICNCMLLVVWPDVGEKVAQFFSKSCPKSSPCSFYIRVRFLRIAQKVANYWGFFCWILCCQELSKIAKSGHTGCWLQQFRSVVRTDLYRYSHQQQQLEWAARVSMLTINFGKPVVSKQCCLTCLSRNCCLGTSSAQAEGFESG